MIKLGEVEYDLTINLASFDQATEKATRQMGILDRRLQDKLSSITRSSESYAKRAKIVGVETENSIKRINKAMEAALKQRTADLQKAENAADKLQEKEKERSLKRIEWIAKNRKTEAAIMRNLAKEKEKNAENIEKIEEKYARSRVAIDKKTTAQLQELGRLRQRALLREEQAIDSYTDRVVADLKRQEAQVRRTAYAWMTIGNGMTHYGRTMAIAFAAIVAPMAAVIKGGADIASSMSLAEAGFGKLTGSTKQAAEIMRQLREETVYSFLTLKQTLPLAQRLAGGFGPQQLGRVMPGLRAIGGAAAASGGGFNEQQRAVNSITSMLSREQVSQRYIQQLSNALPMARIGDILKQRFGTAVAAELKKAGHSAEEVVIAILDNLDKRFGDYQKKLTRNTLPGLISGITDSFQLLGAELTQKQMPVIIKSLQQLFDTLEKLRNDKQSVAALAKLFDALLAPVAALVSGITGLVNWFTKLSPQGQANVVWMIKMATTFVGLNAGISLFAGGIAKAFGWGKLLGVNLKDVGGWMGKLTGSTNEAATALEGASTQASGLSGWLSKLTANPWVIGLTVMVSAYAVTRAISKATNLDNVIKSAISKARGGGQVLNDAETANVFGPVQTARRYTRAATQTGPNPSGYYTKNSLKSLNTFGNDYDVDRVQGKAQDLYHKPFEQLSVAQQNEVAHQLSIEANRVHDRQVASVQSPFSGVTLPTRPPKGMQPLPPATGGSVGANWALKTTNAGKLAQVYSIQDPTERKIALLQETVRQKIEEARSRGLQLVEAGKLSPEGAAAALQQLAVGLNTKLAADIANVRNQFAKKRQTAQDAGTRKQLMRQRSTASGLAPGKVRALTMSGIDEQLLNLDYSIMERGKSKDERVALEEERLAAIHEIHLKYGRMIDDFEDKRRKKELAAQVDVSKREEEIAIATNNTRLKLLTIQSKLLGDNDFEGQRSIATEKGQVRLDSLIAGRNLKANDIIAKMDAAKDPDIKAQYKRLLDDLDAQGQLDLVENSDQVKADLKEIDDKEQTVLEKRMHALTNRYDSMLRAFSRRTKYDPRPKEDILDENVKVRRSLMNRAALENPSILLSDWWQQQDAANESDTDEAAGIRSEFATKKADYIQKTGISDAMLTARGRAALLGRFGGRGRKRRDAQAVTQALALQEQLRDRQVEDKKFGVTTSPEFIKNIQAQINKLTRPRSIWDDFKEDANQKFGNIVDSFSDAVGDIVAKGGSIKKWWKNLWGEAVSWFMSFAVKNVIAGVGQMFGGSRASGGGGGGFFQSMISGIFGGGGGGGGSMTPGASPGGGIVGDGGALTNTLGAAPWETGGQTPPFAAAGGGMAGMAGMAGGAKMMGLGGLFMPFGKAGLFGGKGIFSASGMLGKVFSKWGGFGKILGSASPWIMAAMMLNQLMGGKLFKGVGKVFRGIGKGIKKLFHFDDPVNDLSASMAGASLVNPVSSERSGRDFTKQFSLGVARGMAKLTAQTMAGSGGMGTMLMASPAGRNFLASHGGYSSRDVRSSGGADKTEYHFHTPTFFNRQMMDELSEQASRQEASRIQLRSGRGSFAGRDRR